MEFQWKDSRGNSGAVCLYFFLRLYFSYIKCIMCHIFAWSFLRSSLVVISVMSLQRYLILAILLILWLAGPLFGHSLHLDVYVISVLLQLSLSMVLWVFAVSSSHLLPRSFFTSAIFFLFNLGLLLQLKKCFTSLTGSPTKTWANFSLCSSVCFHFVSPYLFCYCHLFLSYIFSLRCHLAFSLLFFLKNFTAGASPAHHYLSEHPAHCPSLPHFFPWTRNETGSFCPLFIIFHSSYALFVLRVAMLPPPPTSNPCGLPSDSWSEGGREIL